jgi:hypothetical protein
MCLLRRSKGMAWLMTLAVLQGILPRRSPDAFIACECNIWNEIAAGNQLSCHW